MKTEVKFIDLFAGLGGIRLGFEQAAREAGFLTKCILTSEIKTHAIEAYQSNFLNQEIKGDITQIPASDIPDFDFLLAGFPCQPFSNAGSRLGFADTRGTLFFEIERILEAKKPFGFMLENVEGLVAHDNGKTLKVILEVLNKLGYQVSWKVLNALHFGVPQDRKRIFIVGTRASKVSLEFEPIPLKRIGDLLESGLPCLNSKLTQKILGHYKPHELYGKSVKDKRGGTDNIHSWDIEIKGAVSAKQKQILEAILRERRKKHWAEKKGIQWMDGMPLTVSEISSFIQPENLFDTFNLKELLDDLVQKGYLEFEHPKDIVIKTDERGNKISKREQQTHIEAGYNIVVGKLSFEINKILDPNGICPTLVATDMSRIAVIDGQGIRKLTTREGLRLNGFPDSYRLEQPENQAYDLLGNTVAVPVVYFIAQNILEAFKNKFLPLQDSVITNSQNMLHNSGRLL